MLIQINSETTLRQLMQELNRHFPFVHVDFSLRMKTERTDLDDVLGLLQRIEHKDESVKVLPVHPAQTVMQVSVELAGKLGIAGSLQNCAERADTANRQIADMSLKELNDWGECLSGELFNSGDGTAAGAEE